MIESHLDARDAMYRYTIPAGEPWMREIARGRILRIVDLHGNQAVDTLADTCGRHDTLGGACANESNMVRYAIDKRQMHACRSSLLKAVTEWGGGMDKRDIANNINFFMNVPVTPEGRLTFEDGISEPGKYVEMRAETDVIALISNCPQLNNPCNAYNPTPVEVLVWRGREADA